MWPAALQTAAMAAPARILLVPKPAADDNLTSAILYDNTISPTSIRWPFMVNVPIGFGYTSVVVKFYWFRKLDILFIYTITHTHIDSIAIILYYYKRLMSSV